jgi:hypothetical protein
VWGFSGLALQSAGMCLRIAIDTAVFITQMEKDLEKTGGADMMAQSFLWPLKARQR